MPIGNIDDPEIQGIKEEFKALLLKEMDSLELYSEQYYLKRNKCMRAFAEALDALPGIRSETLPHKLPEKIKRPAEYEVHSWSG